MAIWMLSLMALLIAAYTADAQTPSTGQFPVTQLPYKSIQEFLNADPRLSMLLQLAIPSYATLSRTDLRATVFLPTSDAVLTYMSEQFGISDPIDAWSDPVLNKRLLDEFNWRVLPLHLVEGSPLTAAALRDGQALTSALGPAITVAKSVGSITVKGSRNSAFVVAPNQLINNGSIVCHLVSTVLLPPPAPPPPNAPTERPKPPRPPPPAGKPPPSPPPPRPSPPPPPPTTTPGGKSPPPPPPKLRTDPPPPKRPPPPPLPPPPPPPSRPSSPSNSPAPAPSSPKPNKKRPPPPPVSVEAPSPPSPRPPASPPPLPPPRPSPKPSSRPSPSPRPPSPDPPATPPPPAVQGGVDLVSDLLPLGTTAGQLRDLAARGGVGADTSEEQALQVLYRLSPHAAAYLRRNATNVATFFLPSPEAFASLFMSLDDPASLDLPAQIALLRRALTTAAYHAVPGGAQRRTYRAADLLAASSSSSSGGGAVLSSLVPNCSLRATASRGALRLVGSDGGSAGVLQADLALGQRLVVHVIDSVLMPPPDATTPLSNARQQGRPYPSLQSWLADPANLDATLWHLLGALLPRDGSLLGPDGSGVGADDPGLVATLFIPDTDAFLSSPALLSALAAPPPEGSAALTSLLLAHLLPGRAASRADLAALPAGTQLASAAGSPLTITSDGGAVYVNGVQIKQFDRMAAKVVVHTVADVLPTMEWSSPPPPPSPPPPKTQSSPSRASPPPPPRPPPPRSPPPRPPPPPPLASPPPPSAPASPAGPPPSFGSLAAALSGLPELSSLASLYDTASASSAFGIVMGAVLLRPFTMWLPNDQAVAARLLSASPPASLASLASAVSGDPRLVVRLLSPHTLAGRALPAAALADGARLVTGMAGTPGTELQVRRAGSPGSGSVQLVLQGGSGAVVTVLRPDIAVMNKQGTAVQGYIHIVDTFIEAS